MYLCLLKFLDQLLHLLLVFSASVPPLAVEVAVDRVLGKVYVILDPFPQLISQPRSQCGLSVSYTHLTLPTILRV